MSELEINDKKRVALHAADLIEQNMLVGLGTGSTANYFIEALSERQRQGLNVTTVASSVVSTIKAQQLGLPLVPIEQLTRLDVYVDGADEITPEMDLLKGRGSDLVQEKLLAYASDQVYILADETKSVGRLGEKFPIPIEVIPFAWQLVLTALEKEGGRGGLRKQADGLARSAHGSLILDMTFNEAVTSQRLNELLNGLPGIVEHGVFHQLATDIFIAQQGQILHYQHS